MIELTECPVRLVGAEESWLVRHVARTARRGAYGEIHGAGEWPLADGTIGRQPARLVEAVDVVVGEIAAIEEEARKSKSGSGEKKAPAARGKRR